MKLPDYLGQYGLSDLPIDYEWTRLIANGFQENPADDHPKLFDALHLISVKAAYVLGVACSEWAIARLEKHGDVSRALQRVEASWAATVDWRYAQLSKPDSPGKESPDRVLEPLWLTELFLSYDHGFYVKTHRGVKNKGVRGTALRLALLAGHINDKKAGFEKWLTASLRKARQSFPADEVTVQEEKAVPCDFFEPDFKLTDRSERDSQAKLLKSLDPRANPFLRSRKDMRADGYEGDPYPHLK